MRTTSFVLLAGCAVALVALSVSGAPSAISTRLAQRLRPLSDQTDQTATQAAADQTDQAFNAFHAALSSAIAEQVNQSPNVTWTAGMNSYFEDKSYEFLKASCGLKFDRQALGAAAGSPASWDDYHPSDSPLPNLPLPADLQPATVQPANVQPVPTQTFPESFDGRAQWGAKCASLNDIRDQAGCGSCWAVAAAEAITDRTCIASNGTRAPYLSAHEILTCCGQQECGSCEGGYPMNAWQFWMNSGVVTGGSFGSTGTCQPYTWAPCEHHTEGTGLPKCVAQSATPACSSTCTGDIAFQSDKSFGASAYKINPTEDAIMAELMTYGPVEAGFMVYEDFPHYVSGVYKHVTGSMVGGHAIKILGWGVENGEKYWLCANSWNTSWGASGFFKIARGTNECMLEDMVWAGRAR